MLLQLVVFEGIKIVLSKKGFRAFRKVFFVIAHRIGLLPLAVFALRKFVAAI